MNHRSKLIQNVGTSICAGLLNVAGGYWLRDRRPAGAGADVSERFYVTMLSLIALTLLLSVVVPLVVELYSADSRRAISDKSLARFNKDGM